MMNFHYTKRIKFLTCMIYKNTSNKSHDNHTGLRISFSRDTKPPTALVLFITEFRKEVASCFVRTSLNSLESYRWRPKQTEKTFVSLKRGISKKKKGGPQKGLSRGTLIATKKKRSLLRNLIYSHY